MRAQIIFHDRSAVPSNNHALTVDPVSPQTLFRVEAAPVALVNLCNQGVRDAALRFCDGQLAGRSLHQLFKGSDDFFCSNQSGLAARRKECNASRMLKVTERGNCSRIVRACVCNLIKPKPQNLLLPSPAIRAASESAAGHVGDVFGAIGGGGREDGNCSPL